MFALPGEKLSSTFLELFQSTTPLQELKLEEPIESP